MERTKETIIEEIKKVITNNIQPNVAMHGGEVIFQDFDESNGQVTMLMSGSCSGCASSMMTLKMGVENMLKHYVPEVKSVIGVDDPNFNDPYYTQAPFYDTWQEEEFFERSQDLDFDDTGKDQ